MNIKMLIFNKAMNKIAYTRSSYLMDVPTNTSNDNNFIQSLEKALALYKIPTHFDVMILSADDANYVVALIVDSICADLQWESINHIMIPSVLWYYIEEALYRISLEGEYHA